MGYKIKDCGCSHKEPKGKEHTAIDWEDAKYLQGTDYCGHPADVVRPEVVTVDEMEEMIGERCVMYDENKDVTLENDLYIKDGRKVYGLTDDGNHFSAVTYDGKRNSVDFGNQASLVGVESLKRPRIRYVADEKTGDVDVDDVVAVYGDIDRVNERVDNVAEGVRDNRSAIDQNASDIKSLQGEIDSASHLMGYFETAQELIDAVTDPQNGDYGYVTETGTIWSYNDGVWSDTGREIPSGVINPYEGSPLMDGEAEAGVIGEYSRGDHRHPSDSSKVDVTTFDDTVAELRKEIDEHTGGGTTEEVTLSNTITVELGDGATVGGYSTGDVIPEGTTVQTIFNTLFMKQVPPTYTKPSGSLSLSPSTTTYEIGTNVSLSVGVNFNQNDAGSFEGCSFVCSDGTPMESISTTSEKSGWEGVITDSVSFTGTMSYGEGAIKKDNLGNDYPTGHIEAGSLSASSTISGVRNSFYKASPDAIACDTSATIRALGNSVSNLKKGSTVNIAISDGDMHIVFAYPKSLGELSSILQQSSNLDVKGSFDVTTVAVEGAEGYTAVDYYVYSYSALAGLNADTFTVTI